MKLGKTLCTVMVAMTFVLVAGGAAKADDSGKMLLHVDATIAGSHLASGTYDVQWQTHSPAATVSFLHRSKVVATAEGKVVDRGRRYSENEVVYNESSNGERVIQEIRFKGSSEVIEFNQ